MVKSRVIDDLLEALRGNSNSDQSASFPTSSGVPVVPVVPTSGFNAQVNGARNVAPLMPTAPQIPPAQRPSGQPANRPHASAGQTVRRFGGQNPSLSSSSSRQDNFIELQNLLDGTRSTTNEPMRGSTASRQPFEPSSVAPSTSQLQVQRQQQYRGTAVNTNVAAGFRQQQIANARAMQGRGNPSVTGSGTQPTPASGNRSTQSQRDDISSELAAAIARSNASSRPGLDPLQRSNGRAAGSTARQGAISQQSATRNRNSQGRSITQEQIIVGHFCRHAIKTLAHVMCNSPGAAAAEARLKDHIKGVWARWVRSVITRPQLLESVASFVRRSCDAAANIDVIAEFKSWYEREYERQRQRTGNEGNEQSRRHVAQAQRRPSGQNGIGSTRLPAAVASTNSVDRAGSGVRTQAGHRVPVASQQVKQEGGPLPNTGEKRVAGKTVPARQSGPERGVAGKTIAGRGAGRGAASKSVGGKSISRPQGVQKNVPVGREQLTNRALGAGRGTSGRGQAVGRGMGKSPASGRGASVGRGAGGMKADGAFVNASGGKGLPSNKSPTAAKSKGFRKSTAKSIPKPVTKVSPKSSAAPKTKPPPANPAAFTNAQNLSLAAGVPSGKRPLQVGSDSPQGPAGKKAKQTPKVQKGPTPRKKGPGMPDSPNALKHTKSPQSRGDVIKGRPAKKPGQSGMTDSTAGVNAKGAPPAQPQPNQAPPKKPRRGDDGVDELSVVKDIVNIEDEEDKLGMDAGGDASDVQEVFDYGTDMLLSGSRLHTKMQDITRRFGLDSTIGKDVMEMTSLAVRERLCEVFESLREIAAIRTNAAKPFWRTEASGPDLQERLSRMKEDEERALQIASEMRVKRRKEQLDQEARKLAGETIGAEKKTKDSGAAAEAERKEKLALEKKRKEHSSQRDALSAVMRTAHARRKRPTSGKGLAPLESLGKKSLPPIPKIVGAGALVSGDSSSKDGKILDPLEKLNALGPLVKLGRSNNAPANEGYVAAPKDLKRRFTLLDCTFLMKSEPNMRKSSLLYKWSARLGTGN